MPVNRFKCAPYKDTWAAPGSALHEALISFPVATREARAEVIYRQCESDNKKLLEKVRVHKSV